jgi:hypothetical protein
MSPAKETNVTPTTKHTPTGRATICRLAGGVLLIFLSFGAMNLLSHYAADEAAPYAATDSLAPQELNDDATPEASEMLDDLDDIQPDQPADSAGALPTEDPEINHT